MRIVPVVPVIAAVLLLAGCASPAPVAEPEPSPTSTPTPTPTVEAEPSTTVPLACGDVLTEAEASAVVQQPVVLRDVGTTLYNLVPVAGIQAGMLMCEWAPAGDVGFRSALSVWVLSDAATEFTETETAGDSSPDGCIVDPGISRCSVNKLVGDYWLQAFTYSRAELPDRTAEAATTLWDGFVGEATALLESAGPSVEPWTPPASTFRLAHCDGLPQAERYPSHNARVAATQRAPLTSCISSDYQLDLLSGGAWAMPLIAAALPAAGSEMGAWMPWSVPGADAALRADGEVCAALITVGTDLLQVSTASLCSDFEANGPARIAEIIAAG